MDNSVRQTAFNSLVKAKEQIFFAIQFDDAVHRGKIHPSDFVKKLQVPEHYSGTSFVIDCDWEKDPENFQRTSSNSMMNAINGAIMICKESYHESLRVKCEENSDLYAAQMILKCIRDAVGHVAAHSLEEAAPYWDLNENYRKVFEIKRLGISLDARHLHCTQFKWSHIGGLTNLLKILDYLIDDLREKLAT